MSIKLSTIHDFSDWNGCKYETYSPRTALSSQYGGKRICINNTTEQLISFYHHHHPFLLSTCWDLAPKAMGIISCCCDSNPKTFGPLPRVDGGFTTGWNVEAPVQTESLPVYHIQQRSLCFLCKSTSIINWCSAVVGPIFKIWMLSAQQRVWACGYNRAVGLYHSFITQLAEKKGHWTLMVLFRKHTIYLTLVQISQDYFNTPIQTKGWEDS